jgi:hypothetical protein
MVNNTININKTNKHLSPHIIEHQKTKSAFRSWLPAFSTIVYYKYRITVRLRFCQLWIQVIMHFFKTDVIVLSVQISNYDRHHVTLWRNELQRNALEDWKKVYSGIYVTLADFGCLAEALWIISSQRLLNYVALGLQSFYYDRTWWMVFQKRVVGNTLDIDAFKQHY